MSSFNLRGSFLDEYGAEEGQKQFLDDILCWDQLEGSLLDRFGAGDGLDSEDDIMKCNWEQPGASALQLGTPPSHAPLNPESMHIHPPPLAQQPASALQLGTPPSHPPLNPESMDVHPPPLAQQPGTSQPPNITNAADAAKREKIRESKRKSWVKKETERKENEKRLAEVTKENGVLLEANERLEKEGVEAKIKQKKDEQELSNFKEEVSRLNNKLEGQTMQQFHIAEMVVKINEGQERMRAEMVKINEGQERMGAEMVKINEGQERMGAEMVGTKAQERIRAGQRGLKRIRAEMVGTKAQERIRAGQKEERRRAGQRDLKRIRAECYILASKSFPHYTQLQQHSTEEENMLTVPRHMLVRPGEPQHGINIAVTPEDHKEKKRKIDAKYRLGCKTRKEELRIRLHLREENAQLKREKESCWKEGNSMAKNLQSKELEIGHLKRKIGDSKKVISDQTNLLETLSKNRFVQQVMLGPNRLEMVLLENECNKLCQNGKWDNWASERVELLNEIEQLRLRNMMLKMHNQALVDKMLNQKDHRRKHEK